MITHELIIRDEGLTSECVALRSGVGMPPLQREHLSEILYEESVLPSELSDRTLIRTMEAHTEQLARNIGHKWINRHGD